MATIANDQYYYARDHGRGPGAWCVYGPDGFYLPCDDKTLCYCIGKFLSGRVEEAECAIKDWRPADGVIKQDKAG